MPYIIYNGKMVQSSGQYVITLPEITEVTIGTQTWKIKNVDDNISGSKVYNDNESNRSIYGGLYQWTMIGDIEAANPGWHVPSEAEWNTLVTYVGGSSIAGGKLKEEGLAHWDSPNTDATDDYGFSALGAGIGTPYNFIGVYTYFWTSTPGVPANTGRSKSMTYNSAAVSEWNNPITSYFSVRLIKD